MLAQTQLRPPHKIEDWLFCQSVLGGGIRYLLRDLFITTRAAGAVNGTAAEPGPGTRTVVDVESKLSIASSLLTLTPQDTPTWGEEGLRYGGVTRAAGRVLLFLANASDDGSQLIGWDDSTDMDANVEHEFKLRPTTGWGIREGNSWIITNEAGLSLSTDYQVAIVLRALGAFYFIRGGTFTSWTLLWVSPQRNTGTLYPTISGHSATFVVDNFRIPDLTWTPTPLTSDAFTRANGALGTTGGGAVEESGGDGLTWNNRVGTTGIATNAASASALVGGRAIATVDTGTVDAIVQTTLSRAGNEVGAILRYVDADNYIRAIHDGNRCKLIKRVATAETDVISAVVAIGAGAIVVIPDGTSFSLHLNNAKIGSTSTISDAALQTGTEQGLFSTNTDNTQDDFAVWARGTGGEYAKLGQW